MRIQSIVALLSISIYGTMTIAAFGIPGNPGNKLSAPLIKLQVVKRSRELTYEGAGRAIAEADLAHRQNNNKAAFLGADGGVAPVIEDRQVNKQPSHFDHFEGGHGAYADARIGTEEVTARQVNKQPSHFERAEVARDATKAPELTQFPGVEERQVHKQPGLLNHVGDEVVVGKGNLEARQVYKRPGLLYHIGEKTSHDEK